MTDDSEPNQMLDYEEAKTACESAPVLIDHRPGWQRDDTRYRNCSAVWRHENGDEILIHPATNDRAEVLKKSAASGTLRRVRPFDTPQEAEAFVEGLLMHLVTQ